MKEEIIGGVRNALERGGSMEEVIQSFINAGYNPKEVRDAARNMSQGGATAMIHPQTNAAKSTNAMPKLPVKKKSGSRKILIIGVVVLLLIAMGAVAFILLT